jgi:hypothetical protein
MGGTDDPSNLIELTVEEHAEAHRKLFEMHGHWQDELAWKGLQGLISNYDAHRIAMSEGGKKNKGNKTKNLGQFQHRPAGWNKGRTVSTAARKKISDAKIGKPRSEETKRKISETRKKLGLRVGMRSSDLGKTSTAS